MSLARFRIASVGAVHELDDRRVLGRALELLEIDLVVVAHELDRLVAELRKHLVVVGVRSVVARSPAG